jgi:phosphatidylglycerophosphate synthase
MARLRRQQTALGATLDAVADKLMVMPPLWILGFAGIEPLIFWLLVARDACIVGYTLLALSSRERLAVRSNRPGKWYMAVVFCLLMALLLNVPKLAADVIAGAAVIVGFVSLPYYWRRDPHPTKT